MVAMSYCLLPPELLRVGEPTPFPLRDKTGCLLVPRGVMVATESQRLQIISRELYVEEHEGELVKRALAGKVHHLVRNNALLGTIAGARAEREDLAHAAAAPAPGRRLVDPASSWSGLVLRVAALLQDATQADFEAKALRLQQQLLEMLDSDPDNALLILVQATIADFRDYSATHAVLVAVVCELASRHIPTWNADMRRSLRLAALTMNVAMTALQNQLAAQDGPLSARQRELIAGHGPRGAAALRAAGVADELWLGAVEHHHDASAGPLLEKTAACQLARLIQRADIFAARLSPRKGRTAMSANSAAKAAFIDEGGQADEAGAALVKSTGISPPGSYVRLASGEVAVVLRRGLRANEPEVAAIVANTGLPLAEPALRNTRMRPNAVTGGVPPHEVRVRLNVGKLLKLA